MFNGTNNGAIFLSCRDAADRLGLSCLKAVRGAFHELQSLGFISLTIGSSFTIKTGAVSKARAWRLNWIDQNGHCVGPEMLPALNFSQLTKVQKRRVANRSRALSRYLGEYQNGKFAVEHSSTLEARRDFAQASLVEDSSIREREIRQNLPISSLEDSSAYIEYHRGSGSPQNHASHLRPSRGALITVPSDWPANASA